MAGQILVQSVGGGSCPAGQSSPDQLSGGQLLYGLKVNPQASYCDYCSAQPTSRTLENLN